MQNFTQSMNKVIFNNSKTLSSRDIYRQLIIGFGILLLTGLLILVLNNGKNLAAILLLLSIFLFIIWTAKALSESTLKMVIISSCSDEISFVINRQLKIDKVIDFQLKSLTVDIKTKPDRSLPHNKVLTIKDSNRVLTISCRQKGLSEEIFNELVEKINDIKNSAL